MRAALAALLLLVAPAALASEDQCKTKSEARSMYPRAHLYWFNDGDRRCWSNKRGERRASRQRSSKPARHEPRMREADPLPVVPSPPIVPKPEPPDPYRDRAAPSWPTFEALWRHRT
jgi:hypothetical protein